MVQVAPVGECKDEELYPDKLLPATSCVILGQVTQLLQASVCFSVQWSQGILPPRRGSQQTGNGF